MTKMNELLATIKKDEKQCCKMKTIFAIVGAVVVIAGIAFAVYKFLTRYKEEECCDCGCDCDCDCDCECTCDSDNCIEIELTDSEKEVSAAEAEKAE